MFTWVNVF